MRNVILTLVSALAIGAAINAVWAAPSSLRAQTQSSPTQAVVVAVDAFLNTLSPELRAKVQFPFTPQKNATLATFARNGGPPGGPGGRGDAVGRGDAGRQGGDPGRQGAAPGRQGNPGGRGGATRVDPLVALKDE